MAWLIIGAIFLLMAGAFILGLISHIFGNGRWKYIGGGFAGLFIIGLLFGNPEEKQMAWCNKDQAPETTASIQQESVPNIQSAKLEIGQALYVNTMVLKQRASPSTKARIISRYYRQKLLTIQELNNGFARTSRYWRNEQGKKIAAWVSTKYLSVKYPPDLKHPNLPTHPQVNYLPKYGQSGMSKVDAMILHGGAVALIHLGKCASIETGDKSLNRPGQFYVRCKGSLKNIYFNKHDVAAWKNQLQARCPEVAPVRTPLRSSL